MVLHSHCSQCCLHFLISKYKNIFKIFVFLLYFNIEKNWCYWLSCLILLLLFISNMTLTLALTHSKSLPLGGAIIKQKRLWWQFHLSSASPLGGPIITVSPDPYLLCCRHWVGVSLHQVHGSLCFGVIHTRDLSYHTDTQAHTPTQAYYTFIWTILSAIGILYIHRNSPICQTRIATFSFSFPLCV